MDGHAPPITAQISSPYTQHSYKAAEEQTLSVATHSTPTAVASTVGHDQHQHQQSQMHQHQQPHQQQYQQQSQEQWPVRQPRRLGGQPGLRRLEAIPQAGA